MVSSIDKVTESQKGDGDTDCWSVHSCYEWLGEVDEC